MYSLYWYSESLGADDTAHGFSTLEDATKVARHIISVGDATCVDVFDAGNKFVSRIYE